MLYYDLLRSFSVFAEKLNFTHAARELHLSQPALHAQIQKLSEQLGVMLYQRQGRALVLTTQGKQALSFARELNERASAFAEELQGGVSHQPVVLAAGEGAYLYLLGEGIQAFVKRAKVPLRLLTRNQEQTIASLLSGEAHLGVSAIDVVPEGLDAELLARVEQVLVMPSGHKLARQKKILLTSLTGESLILPQADRPHRVAISRALLSVGVHAPVHVEANGWGLMMHFVKLGLGVSIVNSSCKLLPGLVARPLEGLPKLHYQLLTRSNRPLSVAALELKRRLLGCR
jgi:LysR family transcriptional regulator, low CO2-responsive transcriptional regulator